MRKPILAGLLVLCCLLSASAQDDAILLDAYTRNFERGETLSVKLKVLQDTMKTGIKGMGPLYLNALEFVNARASELETDALLRQIALLCADLVKEITFSEAADALWRLFGDVEESVLQRSVLNSLGTIAKDNAPIVAGIERWLEAQNVLKAAGEAGDPGVVMEAVQTLGIIGHGSSFTVLFQTKNAGYSTEVSLMAEEALYSLEGDLKQSFMVVLENGGVTEKRAALAMALKSESLGISDKAELATTALRMGLQTAAGSARELRREALKALSEQKWADATDVAILHFNAAILEHDREIVGVDYLLEAIYGLGALGTHEAAKRLALYLELLNTYTEHGTEIDEQIVIAVIDNLRQLGDKVAFTNLSYVDYVDYSKPVKKKAKEAINNLKW